MSMEREDAFSDGSDESSSEIEELESTALDELKRGVHVLQNRGGSFRCPFCVGKKKQEFRYGDLLQHATGVGKGKGNRGVEAVGSHRALALFLQTDLRERADPLKERTLRLEQDTPQKQDGEELLVWPWMGVVVNIDNTKRVGGKWVGPGNGELKACFASFNPKSVQALWNFHGHLGIAIVEFDGDMIGFGNAQSFERNFIEVGRGRKDWDKLRQYSEYLRMTNNNRELYGWVANQEDYQGIGPVGKYLRDRANLRTVAQVNEETSRKQDQLLQNLNITIEEKNRQLHTSKGQLLGLTNLVLQADLARRQAEAEKKEMEERHKKELQAKEEEAEIVLRKRTEEMFTERLELNEQMGRIKKRCEELEHQEAKNEAEKRKQEEEINQWEEKMRKVLEISELNKKQEEEQIKLLKKHEEEYKNLFRELHQKKKRLLDQQKLELTIQNLEAKIATEKLKDDEANKEKKINEMKEELESLTEEKLGLEEMNKQLTYKERELNDELQEAFKEALKIMQSRNESGKTGIGIKRMGQMNTDAWQEACKRINKDNWEMNMATQVSVWEEKLSDSSWYPFKIIPCGVEKWEKQLNTEDEDILKLRSEYGDAVLESVVTALKELDEYNSSGRYPVSIIWNFSSSKKATMKEILVYLSSTTTARRRRRT